MDVTLDVSNSKVNEERRDRLMALLKRSEVPSLPVVAQKLLELCRDDKASFAEFARLIESDQGLASRLLRVANSAYYGLRHKATTLERAISALGLKYVKTISLGFHLARALYSEGVKGFSMPEFWKQNLIRAVLARQVARQYCPARREEAFLVGLLQDCGVPFLVQAIGPEYARLWQNKHNTQSSMYRMEQELFYFDHMQAARMIMEQWDLPDVLAGPICSHHLRSQTQPSLVEKVQLYQIGYFVGSLTFTDPLSLNEEDITLKDYAESAFNLDAEAINELMIQTKQEFTGISQLFADILPEQLDITRLLENARHTLNELVLEDSVRPFDINQELARFHEDWKILAQKVNRDNETRQPLEPEGIKTLYQMDALKDYLEIACDHVRSMTAPLMLICLEIDRYQEMKELHGQQYTVRIVNELAALLRQLFSEVGCVAYEGQNRYYVALMGPNAKSAVKLTEGLLNKVRGFSCKTSDEFVGRERVTASVGMIYYETGAFPAGTLELIELAEQQLMRVKELGNDGMFYQIVPPVNYAD